jgi:hypothetical protein
MFAATCARRHLNYHGFDPAGGRVGKLVRSECDPECLPELGHVVAVMTGRLIPW